MSIFRLYTMLRIPSLMGTARHNEKFHQAFPHNVNLNSTLTPHLGLPQLSWLLKGARIVGANI